MSSSLLPVGGYGLDSHLFMPVLVLAARPLAQITRVTFVTVGNVIAQDFVRTAYGMGLHPSRVLGNHILHNILGLKRSSVRSRITRSAIRVRCIDLQLL